MRSHSAPLSAVLGSPTNFHSGLAAPKTLQRHGSSSFSPAECNGPMVAVGVCGVSQ